MFLFRHLVLFLVLSAFFGSLAHGDTSATSGTRVIENPVLDGNLVMRVNDGGVKTDAMTVTGSTSSVTFFAPLLAPSGTAPLPSYTFPADLDTGLWRPASNTAGIAAGGQDTFKVGVGGISVGRASASAGPAITVGRSQGTDLATPATVGNGDSMLTMSAQGYSSLASGYLTGASIVMAVDGTPNNTATDMPGRIEFRTTPDGSATPVLGLSIESNGKLEGVAGSPGSPTYGFTADVDTGAYLSASGVYGVSVGGAAKMTVDVDSVDLTTGVDLNLNSGVVTQSGTGGNTPHACTVTSAAATSVTCAAGKIAVGGGISCSIGTNFAWLSRPNPTSGTPTGWACGCDTGTPSCYAICCDN